MSEIIVPKNLLPICDVKGCDMESRFHGLWGNKCWQCYSRWITSWLNYNSEESQQSKQISLDFGN